MTKNKTKPKKKNEVMIVSPIDPQARFMVASEMEDDNMIEAELAGEVLPYFVYQFEDEGKKVTGLTVKGTNEVVRRLNRNNKSGYKITIDKASIKIDTNATQAGKEGVLVTLLAQNLISGEVAIGAKFESFQKNGRKGPYTDKFALEKAISKAERNAKQKLIPVTATTKMIEKLIGENKNAVKKIAPPTIEVVENGVVQSREMTTEEKFSKALIMIQALKTKKGVMQAKSQVESSDIYSTEQKERLIKALGEKIITLKN